MPRGTRSANHVSGEPEPGPSILNELMTAQEVAGLLQMRVSTIEAYARRGLLPSLKVGRHRRFLRFQVEQALRELVEAQSGRA